MIIAPGVSATILQSERILFTSPGCAMTAAPRRFPDKICRDGAPLSLGALEYLLESEKGGGFAPRYGPFLRETFFVPLTGPHRAYPGQYDYVQPI